MEATNFIFRAVPTRGIHACISYQQIRRDRMGVGFRVSDCYEQHSRNAGARSVFLGASRRLSKGFMIDSTKTDPPKP